MGPALTAGLASVAAVQPDDPVEYLAHWLLKYLAIEEKKFKVTDAPSGAKRHPATLDMGLCTLSPEAALARKCSRQWYRSQMAESAKAVLAEKEAAEASETAKTTAREEKFFKVKKAMDEVAACTSTGQMYDLMVKTVSCLFAMPGGRDGSVRPHTSSTHDTTLIRGHSATEAIECHEPSVSG